jgi:hypothetical protein
MRKVIVEAEVSLDGVIGGDSPEFWTKFSSITMQMFQRT